MKENNREQAGHGPRRQGSDSSIGNQQYTTQTGGQNAGGENRDQQEDKYTDDLRKSGNRNSSNKKNESETGR